MTITEILKKLSSLSKVEKRWIFAEDITKKKKEAVIHGYKQAIKDFRRLLKA